MYPLTYKRYIAPAVLFNSIDSDHDFRYKHIALIHIPDCRAVSGVEWNSTMEWDCMEAWWRDGGTSTVLHHLEYSLQYTESSQSKCTQCGDCKKYW